MTQVPNILLRRSLTEDQLGILHCIPFNHSLVISEVANPESVDDYVALPALDQNGDTQALKVSAVRAPGLSVMSWSKSIEQSQILPPEQQPLQQPQLLPQAPQPTFQSTQSLQPLQQPAPDTLSVSTAIISLISDRTLFQTRELEPKSAADTNMRISQLIDVMSSDLSLRESVIAQQTHSQNLDAARQSMRQSLCLTQDNKSSKAYIANKHFRTVPRHAHLARMFKAATSKGVTIPCLAISNANGSITFAAASFTSLNLQRVSINAESISLSSELSRLPCTAILYHYRDSPITAADLDGIRCQAERRHAQYSAIVLDITDVEQHSGPRPHCARVVLSLNKPGANTHRAES